MKPDTEEMIKGSILQGQVKQFPEKITIPQYFSDGFRTGRLRAENLALVDGEKKHTFQQLDDISTKIAQAILEFVREQQQQQPNIGESSSSNNIITNRNPDGDTVIGVCIQPSDRLITILFGILKAGAAYVPFDITFPEERIIRITKDCQPILVICDGKSNVLGKFASVNKSSYTRVISTEDLYRRIRPNNNFTGLRTNFTTTANKYGAPSSKKTNNKSLSETTAVILYTSGSSGEPKGVRLSHRAVMNRLNWQWEQFPFIPTEKCVFKTALTFVDSVPEIFGPLLQGFQLVVFDKTVTSQTPLFMEKLHAYEITRVVLVPSLLKAIFQTFNIIGKQEGRRLLSSVRHWVCSGEALSFDVLTEFFENLPQNFTLCNFYGSTEIMGDVTYLPFSSMEDVKNYTLNKKTPIGFPVFNTTIYVLNDQLQPAEEGQTGEIFIAGSNLATGYVGIPESDKFLPINRNIQSSTSAGNMYRTGDFGRIAKLPNNESVLLYEGRIDSQVKVRGYRVDLSEIEAVITGFESVSKVKVLCYHPGQPDQAIVAYVVPRSSLYAVDHIKLNMDKSLREFERPILRILKEIPLLVNGKTDRQRLLKSFEAEMQKREEFDDWGILNIPENKLHIAKALFKIISNVTGTSLQTIAENTDDSFFNIGGTSLNTVEVIVKLREMGLFISIADFTFSSNIREIFMKISTVEEESSSSSDENSLVKLTKGEDKEYVISTLTKDDKQEVIQ